MKSILTFLIICLIFKYHSQNETIELRFVDSLNNKSIENVLVKFENVPNQIEYLSNQKGKVYIDKNIFRILVLKDVILSCSHNNYETYNFDLNDSISFLKIRLQKKIQNLETVTAYAQGVPQIIFQSKKLSVSDFEIIPNDELLLLLYPKTLKKGSQLAILNSNQIVSEFKLNENPIELIHDFKRMPHIVCEKGVYGVHRNENGVGLSSLERAYFMKFVFPIIDTSYSKYYFSNFNKHYPAFDYKSFDQIDSTYALITEIKDELMMELYRSEYKWADIRTKIWAKELENETGIDKEIWVGANYFTNSIYYKQLYAPLFVKSDTLYVFDHYKNKMFKYNNRGVALDSLAIDYHLEPKKTGWRNMLIQDYNTNRIYAFFQKDGICSVQEINLHTGKLDSKIEFKHTYIDKIQIIDGMAYYIYRPYESNQKKYLYRVKLE